MPYFGQGYVAFVLIVMLVLLLALRLRAELVALLVLIALEVPGVLTRDEALSGFSNSAVITIIGLFVLSHALEQTGVADKMGGWLVRFGGTSERTLIVLVMLTAAGLSLVMNNIAAGAVVLPAGVLAARRTGISPAKLLMPLAFGASLGGMATIFTTANIIVSNALRDQGQTPLGFLSFFPIGGLAVIAGISYMVLLGRRWLPSRDPLAQAAPRAALPDVYQLQERLWEMQITPESSIAGCTLGDADLGERFGVTVVAVFHGQSANLMPGPDTVCAAGDVLLVAGREERVREIPDVQIGRQTHTSSYLANPEVQFAELVVAPRASILGKTLRELEFRRRYGVTVVAVWHNGRSQRTGIGDIPLNTGDALLVVGALDRLQQVVSNPSFVLLSPLPLPVEPRRFSKRPYALGTTALVLLLSTPHWVPTSIAVLIGVVLLVLTHCVTMDEALASIEWKTIFVIAGLLPLSIAMDKTGLAATIGNFAVASIGGYGFVPLAAGLYLTTVIMTQVLGGQVTALVMAPIALAAATRSGVSAHEMGVVVAIACSSSFLTPFAHPVNLLVATPGGYSFRDFFRVGLGLTLVCFVVVILAAALLPSG